MTIGEIQAHLLDIYGTEVSKDFISNVTDSIIVELEAWQNRPLDSVYPIVYMDAIRIKSNDGNVANSIFCCRFCCYFIFLKGAVNTDILKINYNGD